MESDGKQHLSEEEMRRQLEEEIRRQLEEEMRRQLEEERRQMEEEIRKKLEEERKETTNVEPSLSSNLSGSVITREEFKEQMERMEEERRKEERRRLDEFKEQMERMEEERRKEQMERMEERFNLLLLQTNRERKEEQEQQGIQHLHEGDVIPGVNRNYKQEATSVTSDTRNQDNSHQDASCLSKFKTFDGDDVSYCEEVEGVVVRIRRRQDAKLTRHQRLAMDDTAGDVAERIMEMENEDNNNDNNDNDDDDDNNDEEGEREEKGLDDEIGNSIPSDNERTGKKKKRKREEAKGEEEENEDKITVACDWIRLPTVFDYIIDGSQKERFITFEVNSRDGTKVKALPFIYRENYYELLQTVLLAFPGFKRRVQCKRLPQAFEGIWNKLWVVGGKGMGKSHNLLRLYWDLKNGVDRDRGHGDCHEELNPYKPKKRRPIVLYLPLAIFTPEMAIATFLDGIDQWFKREEEEKDEGNQDPRYHERIEILQLGLMALLEIISQKDLAPLRSKLSSSCLEYLDSIKLCIEEPENINSISFMNQHAWYRYKHSNFLCWYNQRIDQFEFARTIRSEMSTIFTADNSLFIVDQLGMEAPNDQYIEWKKIFNDLNTYGIFGVSFSASQRMEMDSLNPYRGKPSGVSFFPFNEVYEGHQIFDFMYQSYLNDVKERYGEGSNEYISLECIVGCLLDCYKLFESQGASVLLPSSLSQLAIENETEEDNINEIGEEVNNLKKNVWECFLETTGCVPLNVYTLCNSIHDRVVQDPNLQALLLDKDQYGSINYFNEFLSLVRDMYEVMLDIEVKELKILHGKFDQRKDIFWGDIKTLLRLPTRSTILRIYRYVLVDTYSYVEATNVRMACKLYEQALSIFLDEYEEITWKEALEAYLDIKRNEHGGIQFERYVKRLLTSSTITFSSREIVNGERMLKSGSSYTHITISDISSSCVYQLGNNDKNMQPVISGRWYLHYPKSKRFKAIDFILQNKAQNGKSTYILVQTTVSPPKEHAKSEEKPERLLMSTSSGRISKARRDVKQQFLDLLTEPDEVIFMYVIPEDRQEDLNILKEKETFDNTIVQKLGCLSVPLDKARTQAWVLGKRACFSVEEEEKEEKAESPQKKQKFNKVIVSSITSSEEDDD